MIELAFGESAAGGLKLAKSMKQRDRIIGTAGVIGDTRNERCEARKSRTWSGITMEGSSADVEALTLALDVGDISDMATGINPRQKLMEELFADLPEVPGGIIKTNQHALARLEEVKETLEPVRMWVCTGNPEEMCGLYYVCSLLSNAPTPLSVVRVPEQIEKDNVIVSYRHIGEINPEAFGAYTCYEEPISKVSRCVYANTWIGLVHENAPLRAAINGSIIGVPKEFYDFALRANMPDGEFKVALLVGKTLGQISGVSDRWLFLRIQAMLQSGELISISAAADNNPYSEVVKRNNMDF